MTRINSGNAGPDAIARSAEASSLLVDSAISHAEKLRRVLVLEEWINSTTADNPLPAATRRKWQQEREQLLAELRLEELTAENSGPVKAGAGERSRPRLWLRKLIRRLRHSDVTETSSS